MKVLKPRRTYRRAGGPGKVRDVVELAVMRVRQDPGGFDPALLFLDLEPRHKVVLIREMSGRSPRRSDIGSWEAARFARIVCDLAEQAGPLP